MSYLARRATRLAFTRLKHSGAFGFALSSLLIALGTFNYFLVPYAQDHVWLALAIIGAVGLAITVFFPLVWRLPERFLAGVTQRVGSVVFGAFLTIVYLILFWPIGAALRQISGSSPIFAWERTIPSDMEGWRPKTIFLDGRRDLTKSRGLFQQLMSIFRFFLQRRLYFFIPALVVLIALGLVLFFVKSSALAPFIYTLF